MELKIGDEVVITRACPYCTGDRKGIRGVVTSLPSPKGFLNLYAGVTARGKKQSEYRGWIFCENCVSVLKLDEFTQNISFIYGENNANR